MTEIKNHTFVLCAYKESQFLEECVQSLLAQTVKSKILISTSTPNDHIKGIAEKYNLPFILLSDPERKAIEAYGVWQEKKLYGKLGFGIVRSTYIIDEKGIIQSVMPKVKPDTNAQEILAEL